MNTVFILLMHVNNETAIVDVYGLRSHANKAKEEHEAQTVKATFSILAKPVLTHDGELK